MRCYKYFYIILFLFFFSSCYKEQVRLPDDNSKVFNFVMTDFQEQSIYNSRGVRLTFNDTLPVLQYSGEVYNLDQFEIRGQSSLKFRRKGFSVNMDDNLLFFIEEQNRLREIEKIKFAALVFDYTYIENYIAIEIFKLMDLWPVFSFYTEVKLNGNTQGIYLLVEDVEDYFMYEEGADFVLRRYFQSGVDGYEINDQKQVKPEEYYLARFDSIYSYITQFSGKQLYDSLSNLLDLQQYFTKIAIDMFLKNGDATDELFFYSKERGGKQIFGVFPWDYDDIFQEFPHEIGRFRNGNLFGYRSYSSMDDVIADVGHKLIFSIEDDLDYIIAKDDFLYQQYLKILEHVMSDINNISIEGIFSDAKNTLQPFYDHPEIVSQSKYDADSTNQELFDENLYEKKHFLLDRRQWILDQLPKHMN